MNNVLLAGKLQNVRESSDTSIVEAEVEVQSRIGYGSDAKVRHNTFPVLFVGNTAQLLNKEKSGKFVTLTGVIAERRVNKDVKDSPTQTYILVSQILGFSDNLETQKSEFQLSGSVSYIGESSFTATGTPKTRLGIKNVRTTKDKERTMMLFGTAFKLDDDLGISKGQSILVSGNLDSYVNEKAGGVLTITGNYFEVFPIVESKPKTENVDLNSDISTNKQSVMINDFSNPLVEEGLPF